MRCQSSVRIVQQLHGRRRHGADEVAEGAPADGIRDLGDASVDRDAVVVEEAEADAGGDVEELGEELGAVVGAGDEVVGLDALDAGGGLGGGGVDEERGEGGDALDEGGVGALALEPHEEGDDMDGLEGVAAEGAGEEGVEVAVDAVELAEGVVGDVGAGLQGEEGVAFHGGAFHFSVSVIDGELRG